MAAVISPSIILGEREDTLPDSPPGAVRPAPFWERRTATPRFAVAARAARTSSLIDVVDRLETCSSTTVTFAERDLPPSCRSRTAFVVLHRRAQRAGKDLRFDFADADLRLLARAAGVDHGRLASLATHAGRSPNQEVAADPPLRGGEFAPAGDRAPRETVPRSERAAVVRHDDHERREPWAAAPTPRGRTASLGRATLEWAAIALTQISRVAPNRAPHLARAGRVRVPRSLAPVLALGGVAGSVMMALAVAVVPTASVQLTPAAERWTAEIPVVVDPAIKKPDVANGKLPARTISKEVAETKQVPTTGRKPAPDARAAGEVVFINKTDKSLSVPKGAVVAAGNVKFTTQADVSVSGTVFAGPQQRWGMGRIAISAVEGGPAGNVERFRINKLEGPLAGSLDVQNDAPTRGGSDKTVAFVTADDRKKLQDSLFALLSDRLNQQVKGQLPNPDRETTVPWTGQNPSVVEATFSKNVDEEATTLSLTMKLRYGVTVFNNDGYNALVKQIAGSRSGQIAPGYDLVRGTVEAQPPAIAGVDGGVVRLTARASATAVPSVDIGKLRSRLVNRTLADANAVLGAVPGIVSYQVRAWPGWSGRMPLLGFRIAIAAQVPPAGG